MSFECYSQRMLNPFRGIVSCIRYESADAVTADGEHWDIYVSNEALLSGLADGQRPQISDIRYGSWSEQRGLKRGPVYPSDDFLLMEEMGYHVYRHLLEVSREVPFPLLDRFELWLLDPDGQPLALIDSALTAEEIDRKQQLDWRPGLECRRTFTSPVARRLVGEHAIQGALTDYLAGYINGRAGPEPAAQLFRRDADGSGTGLWGINLPATREGRTLSRDEFPLHLLEMQQHDELHAQLIHDFICWQAPWQLLLPDMDDAVRGAFEQHARVQSRKVARQYRLYPHIVDRGVIDAARVEARLRATHQRHQPAEQVMSTFYIELGQEQDE